MPSLITYDQVKVTLPNLTQTQIKDLSNRCKALLNRNDETVDNDWLLEGALDELRLRQIPIMPIDKIKRSTAYLAYAEKSKTVRSILESQAKLTRLQKRQLAKICTQCLIEHLRTFTDVSVSSVLTFIDRIPEALERSFPGYLSSQLLFFIIRNPVQLEND